MKLVPVGALAGAIVASASLSGCAFLQSLLGASGPEIVGFDIDNIVGTATIDPQAKTVKATVRPVDVGTLTPRFTVSDNGSVTASSLVDGQPVDVTITGQTGATTTWKVTVTAEYGASFTLGSQYIVMTHGAVYSGDAAQNADYGNDTPMAIYDSDDAPGGYTLIALSQTLDENPNASSVNEDLTVFTLYENGTGTGSYAPSTSGASGTSTFSYALDWDQSSYNSPTGTGTGITLNVTRFPDSIGETLEATFAGAVEDSSQGSGTVAGGFIKVKRIADGTNISSNN